MTFPFPAFSPQTSPSYSNTGGTGNRTSIITVTSTLSAPWVGTPPNLVNGAFASNGTDSFSVTATAAAGIEIKFDFGSGASKKITEAKWYQSTTDGHGTWKWQGSLDGAAWTDLGASFTLGGATTQTQTTLSANTSWWRYYRLVGISGTFSTSPYINEVEFMIA